MAGIYLHIPFCRKACHYCNFHFSTGREYQDRMVGALALELEQRADYLENATLQSIYFGGGTPSLLDHRQLEFLFDTIFHFWHVAADAEITLEANPDDLTPEYLDMLHDTPVNRLSIGIQSFHDRELQWMNRVHDARQARECLGLARQKGFERLTADLIYGVPGQSLKDWQENLDILLDSGTGHLSAYALTAEPRTALGTWIKKGQVSLPPDELVREQFDWLMDRSSAAGLEQYEISNFSREKERAVHNANYWKGAPYLGIGPSAHSFDGASREWNEAHNIHYMDGVESGQRPFERELLTEADRYNEYVMTGLRTIWGVTADGLRALGHNWLEHFQQQLPTLTEKGWIRHSDDRWTLTREGKHWADQAAAELFFTG